MVSQFMFLTDNMITFSFLQGIFYCYTSQNCPKNAAKNEKYLLSVRNS